MRPFFSSAVLRNLTSLRKLTTRITNPFIKTPVKLSRIPAPFLSITRQQSSSCEEPLHPAPIVSAAQDGDVNLLRMIMNLVEGDPDEKTDLNNAFKGAVACCHFDCVNLLLSTGKIDQDPFDSAGTTPLIAIASLDYSILPLYIRMHAMKEACAIAEKLIEHGSQVNIINKNGKTPLLLAVKSGNVDLVSLLLKHKAKVEYVDLQGNTALSVAMNGASYQQSAMIPLLQKALFRKPVIVFNTRMEKAEATMLKFKDQQASKAQDSDQRPASEPTSEPKKKGPQ